jgi:hypothetical protein
MFLVRNCVIAASMLAALASAAYAEINVGDLETRALSGDRGAQRTLAEAYYVGRVSSKITRNLRAGISYWRNTAIHVPKPA